MNRRLLIRSLAAGLMVLLVAGLLYWQHVRFELVGACQDKGGQWDGAAGRCRLLPPIYLERGIKRSVAPPAPGRLDDRAQKRSMR